MTFAKLKKVKQSWRDLRSLRPGSLVRQRVQRLSSNHPNCKNWNKLQAKVDQVGAVVHLLAVPTEVQVAVDHGQAEVASDNFRSVFPNEAPPTTQKTELFIDETSPTSNYATQHSQPQHRRFIIRSEKMDWFRSTVGVVGRVNRMRKWKIGFAALVTSYRQAADGRRHSHADAIKVSVAANTSNRRRSFNLSWR